MCGIIGYIGKKPVVPLIIEGLKKLEYRGYDSAGIAVVDREEIKVRRAKGKISSLESNLNKNMPTGTYGIGHTRWATHGRPSEENAHPHRDCSGTLVVIHNGIIENYLPLKKMLKEKGHIFKTETDTEVIAHLLEEYFDGSLENAVYRAVRELEGAYSIVAISSKDPGKIVVVKEKSPAVVGIGKGEFFVASDINAFLEHTQEVVFLNDGEIACVGASGLKFSDFNGKSLKKKSEFISWNPQMIEKRGYKHFMLKEIFEQPQVIRDTLEGRLSLDDGQIHLDEIGIPEDKLKKISRIVIVACGTSFHAGLIGKHFIESLAKIPVDVEYASEYRYRDPVIDPHALNVFISQSGETLDSLAALKSQKSLGQTNLAISNVFKSSIAREADGVLYTHAGPEIGVAATKTFVAQLTALALLALYLGQTKGALCKDECIDLIQDLQRLPHKSEEILEEASLVETLALNFLSFSHFLYLGRGISFPVALEGALKLKEISYIHAEAYPGGEMKHGPIALIDEKMPTMAVIPKDHVHTKMLSNIAEIKSRNGYVLAVASRDDEEILDKVDRILFVPRINPLFTPFLTTIPLQLFSYFIAAAKGEDVDQPRNLAKSVTVE